MRLTLGLVILLVVTGQLTAAQNPFDPFGGAKPQPAGAGQPADPFGAGKPAAKPKMPAAKPKQGELPPIEEERDPVVLTIRESDPTTPDELMFAIETLWDMDRPAETKFYIRKLIGLSPDQKVLTGLQRQLGSAFFYRLSRNEVLKPEGEVLGKAVLKAAYDAARDPARLRAQIKQLSEPSFGPRQQATEDLRGVGVDALPFFLEALADPNRANEHPQIRTAIVQLGKAMVDALT
jgi:hypothetical protein